MDRSFARRVAGFTVSSGCAVLTWCALEGVPDVDSRLLFTGFAVASAILLGFLLVAQALLRANESRTLIRNMGKTGHLEALLRDLHFTTAACCVALAIPLIGFLAAEGAGRYAVAFSTGSSVFMQIEFWSTERKFHRVMTHLD